MGGGEGVDGAPPPSFIFVAVMILPLVETGFDLPSKMKYILWVVALLEGCDVAKHGRHVGRHLEFCPELEIR